MVSIFRHQILKDYFLVDMMSVDFNIKSIVSQKWWVTLFLNE